MEHRTRASNDGRSLGASHKFRLLIVVDLGEDGILYGAADAERKCQLAIYEFAPGQTAEGVGEEALLSGDLRHTPIVERVRAGNADTAGAIHINAITINIDFGAGKAS